MKHVKYLFILIFICFSFTLKAQHVLEIDAQFSPEINTVKVKQSIRFKNTSPLPISIIYLSDWNNSSSNNQSELAKRFAEEYSNKLHFAKESIKGFTKINGVNSNDIPLTYKRIATDIIEIHLKNPLSKNEYVDISLEYDLQLPSDRFTRFGIDSDNNIKLKEWFIIPAKLNDNWVYYSNKNLDDLYAPGLDISLNITYPNDYTLNSNFNFLKSTNNKNTITSSLQIKNSIASELHLSKNNKFETIQTDKFSFVSNINDGNLSDNLKAVIHDKIAFFITDKLGNYPHKKILLSEVSYRKNPVYGLNQLPKFIRPFPDGFQYEIKILKSTVSKFITNTVNTNPRNDFWLNDALETYLMIKYVEENYPNMKILGSLSHIWGLRTIEIAKKNFNDQYQYFNNYTARKNLDQSLSTPKDSLLKFNANIANKNKAGVGLIYLNDYLGNQLIDQTISEFYQLYKSKDIKSEDFITLLQSKTDKDIEWFIDDYIKTDNRFDYTISKIVQDQSNLNITLKNRAESKTPVSIYQLIDGKIISKDYIKGFSGSKTFQINNHNPDKVVLNYEHIIPEYNERNNTKTLKPHLFNKPLKLSFVKDAEAPNHNQIFYMPEFGYNLYDGFSPGLRISNKSIFNKNLTYSIKPLYGMRSKELAGSTGVKFKQYFKQKRLFSINYSLQYQNYQYKEDLRYQKFNPSIAFIFRKKNNLRTDYRQYINARFISVNKDEDPNPELDIIADGENIPNYNIINLKYGIGDAHLLNSYSFNTDLQFSKQFGKLSINYNYKKSFNNNRQIKFRVFAGSFLYNNTIGNTFSFALDRPTDYLFDYDYYGRSEGTGIYSQQIIIAEGGFKSKLSTPYANEWMTTATLSTTIWKYIFAYGDVGLVGNTGNTNTVYDTGIHLNLVPNYFELYFPVSSNLGWEIAQPNYGEKIRFKITLTPKVLIGLFNRKWL